MKSDRYDRALIRNLHETGTAILERRALVGLEVARSYHGMDFFRLAYNALFNDMIAHAIKVLDRNSQSTSFWYLYRTDSGIVDSFLQKNGTDLKALEALSDKLKHIRDKTHFHIDRQEVFDPKQVWRSAGVTGKELSQCLDQVFMVLQYLHENKIGGKFELPDYDGTDATAVVKIATESGIIPD